MENFLSFEQFAAAVTLSKRVHWLRIAEDGVVEIYLDHHALAMFRMCPARFKLEMIDGYKVKTPEGVGTGFWALEFGILIHRVLEWYYVNFRKATFTMQAVVTYAEILWHEMNMEYFVDDKGYKNLGGLVGLKTLIMMYFTRFGPENERMRVVGTELYFGKGKEVPLQEQPSFGLPFRLYYAGKIDLLIDDGSYIAPLDHKSTSDFRGKDPQQRFIIQEGMTGYIYANKFMVRHVMGLDPSSRLLNMIYMNHIQLKSAAIQERFKRVPLYKTDAELEAWRRRQIATARDLFNSAIGLITTPQLPFWYNANVCTNWFHSECLYYKVHRVDPLTQISILKNEYEVKPVWNPETRDERESVLNSLEHL
jgi:hypothetical protein